MAHNFKSDEVLAYSLLRQDLFFSKIPAEERAGYLRCALEAGAAAAAEHAHRPVREWYAHYNIAITYKEKGGAFGGAQFRAQIDYAAKEPRITLYRQAVGQLAQVCPDIETVILGHELFHYLEVSQNRHISDLMPRVVTMKAGPFRQTASIKTLSEIAAHKFAKDMAGLPYLPNYYDYLYLTNAGKLSAPRLSASLKAVAGEYHSL